VRERERDAAFLKGRESARGIVMSITRVLRCRHTDRKRGQSGAVFACLAGARWGDYIQIRYTRVEGNGVVLVSDGYVEKWKRKEGEWEF